jgi:hypothetical protein
MGLHRPAWGIPPERITGLPESSLLFAEVKSAGRNSVNTGQCRLAFL